MQGILSNKTTDADYLVLDKLIPSNHLLRKVNQCIDFSFVNELTEECYSSNNGRPSIPPELYFRIMLINYLYAIKSTRRLVQEIHYNISYRWFCKLTLKDSIPNHASLSRIKKRYSTKIFEGFFNAILTLCKEAGLLCSNSTMTDSTLFQANASLNSMRPINKEEPNHFAPRERGVMPPKRNISNKTHQSKTDPDATLAFKSGTTRSLKYKAHVCCDSLSRVIVAIKITTGAVHDSQPYIGLLDHVKTNLGLPIQEAIADRGYGSGHIISSLQAVGIKPFIPLFSTRSGGSTNSVIPGFQYNNEQNTYICPANFALKPGKVTPQDYVLYHSSVTNCRNCPIKENCLAPKKKNKDIRVITRHIHFDLFHEMKIEMETDMFKQKLTERLWKIEGIMNELKNYHCLSKARYRGLNNVQIQAFMAAIAINIKRLVNFLLLSIILYFMDKVRASFTTGRNVN